LLSRPATRDLVDRGTRSAVAARPTPDAVAVRISVLEALQRRQDLGTLLQTRVEAAATSTELTTLQEHARRLGFDRTEERAGERLAAIANDPVDKMRLTLARARLLESKKDVVGASRVVDTLYRDHPLILGVIRGAADFHVRNRQPDPAIELLLDAAGRARADLVPSSPWRPRASRRSPARPIAPVLCSGVCSRPIPCAPNISPRWPTPISAPKTIAASAIFNSPPSSG
jgi:hypothetical protein